MNVKDLTITITKAGRKWLHATTEFKGYSLKWKIEKNEISKNFKAGETYTVKCNIEVKSSGYGKERIGYPVNEEKMEEIKKEENTAEFHRWLSYVKDHSSLYENGMTKCLELSEDNPKLRAEYNEAIAAKKAVLCDIYLSYIKDDIKDFWRTNKAEFIEEHGTAAQKETLEELRAEREEIVNPTPVKAKKETKEESFVEYYMSLDNDAQDRLDSLRTELTTGISKGKVRKGTTTTIDSYENQTFTKDFEIKKESGTVTVTIEVEHSFYTDGTLSVCPQLAVIAAETTIPNLKIEKKYKYGIIGTVQLYAYKRAIIELNKASQNEQKVGGISLSKEDVEAIKKWQKEIKAEAIKNRKFKGTFTIDSSNYEV